MPKLTAIRLRVDLGTDRRVQLPNDIPMGPVEVIVLHDEPIMRSASEKSVLGLFAAEPEVVDEAMAFVRDRRARSRRQNAR